MKSDNSNNSIDMTIVPPVTWTNGGVVYIQAWAAAGLAQVVTVSGPGLPEKGISAPYNPQATPPNPNVEVSGMQFLNQQLDLKYVDYPAPWVYTVSISYYNADGVLTSSNVISTKSTLNLDNKMFSLTAISNDNTSDQDFNDCVVQISAFGNSTD